MMARCNQSACRNAGLTKRHSSPWRMCQLDLHRRDVRRPLDAICIKNMTALMPMMMRVMPSPDSRLRRSRPPPLLEAKPRRAHCHPVGQTTGLDCTRRAPGADTQLAEQLRIIAAAAGLLQEAMHRSTGCACMCAAACRHAVAAAIAGMLVAAEADATLAHAICMCKGPTTP